MNYDPQQLEDNQQEDEQYYREQKITDEHVNKCNGCSSCEV